MENLEDLQLAMIEEAKHGLTPKTMDVIIALVRSNEHLFEEGRL